MSCGQQGEDGRQDAGDVAQLRAEVAALRSEVADLRDRLDRQAATIGAAVFGDGGVASAGQAPVAGSVTFRFRVLPAGAQLSLDGDRLKGRVATVPRGSAFHTVTIRRPGYRSVVQRVSAVRDRTLEYRLMPGRGVHRLGSLVD